MADVVRLKSWKTYLTDGRSSVTYDAPHESVAVAVILGIEPLTPQRTKDCVDVDSVIVDIAKFIQKERRSDKKRGRKKSG